MYIEEGQVFSGILNVELKRAEVGVAEDRSMHSARFTLSRHFGRVSSSVIYTRIYLYQLIELGVFIDDLLQFPSCFVLSDYTK